MRKRGGRGNRFRDTVAPAPDPAFDSVDRTSTLRAIYVVDQ